MKVLEIVNAYEGLVKLAEERIDGGLAFCIGLAKNKIESEYKCFQEKKDELVKKFGTDDTINPDHVNWKDFVSELNKILETEVDIHVYKIKLSALEKVNTLGNHILAVLPLIENDKGE
jgi:hypothetical protein